VRIAQRKKIQRQRKIVDRRLLPTVDIMQIRFDREAPMGITVTTQADYECRDCGARIFLLGLKDPPEHHRCVICAFIHSLPDCVLEEDRTALRQRLIRERDETG
jgi:hypothetical protein